MSNLPQDFYKSVRSSISNSLPDGAVLILAGNSQIERTNDVPYPFRQRNNFLYLTGISQPDAYLVLTSTSEQLYIKQLHPFMEVWEGRSNQIDKLKKISGVEKIVEYKKTEDFISDVLPKGRTLIYLDTPDSIEAQPATWYLWRLIQDEHPHLEIASINDQINQLRLIKSEDEVALIKEAISHTESALNHIRPLLKQGVTELEIASEFIRFASIKGFEQAFPPIVSFGKNSCVIHHTPDDTKLKNGDLVLFDVGLEVGGYASDISRTIHVGSTSDRQKQIYQAVLDVQTQAIKLMRPGIKFDDFEKQAAEIMQDKLVQIGLFESIKQSARLEGDLQWPAYRRYFNHYISHYLGLDAHDVGPRDAALKPGMVLTCEPGIYIADEGIGVRIEDDILITADGNINLSAGVFLDN